MTRELLVEYEATQRELLVAERLALAEALRAGQRPWVCLSGPSEPRRLVQLESLADLDSHRLPYRNLSARR